MKKINIEIIALILATAFIACVVLFPLLTVSYDMVMMLVNGVDLRPIDIERGRTPEFIWTFDIVVFIILLPTLIVYLWGFIGLIRDKIIEKHRNFNN